MKLRNVFSLIGNLISFSISGLLIAGIFVNNKGFNPLYLGILLPLLAVCFFALTSFVGIILDIIALSKKKFIKSNFYLSLRLLGVTFLISSVSLTLLLTKNVADLINVFDITTLVLCLYSLIAFIFLDATFKAKYKIVIAPSVGNVIYFGVIYLLYFIKVIGGFPYQFMDVITNQNELMYKIIVLSSFVLVPILLGFILTLLANIASKHYVLLETEANNENVKQTKTTKKAKQTVTTTTKKSEKTVSKKVEKKPAIKTPVKKIKIPKDISIDVPKDLDLNYKIYHVTKRSDANFWQVKYGKDVKCIKLFVEKDEALNYVKILASLTGASVRVHGENGKIEKI